MGVFFVLFLKCDQRRLKNSRKFGALRKVWLCRSHVLINHLTSGRLTRSRSWWWRRLMHFYAFFFPNTDKQKKCFKFGSSLGISCGITIIDWILKDSNFNTYLSYVSVCLSFFVFIFYALQVRWGLGGCKRKLAAGFSGTKKNLISTEIQKSKICSAPSHLPVLSPIISQTS